ncbi:hypothetical protein [Candidatus Symbiopectobacterium sp. 'North America']|nr:hypothetical protein [Candidatus Symbiopectobacterium sp. 'North America']
MPLSSSAKAGDLGENERVSPVRDSRLRGNDGGGGGNDGLGRFVINFNGV